MVTIKITKVDNLGVPPIVDPAEVEFQASVVYGRDHYKKRFGQVTKRALDGDQHTFDRGVTVVYGELSIRGMDVPTKEALDDFISGTTKMNFNEHYFKIVTTPCATSGGTIDLGSGFGVPSGVCKFGEDFKSTDGLFKFKAPGLFDVRIPYTYLF